MNTDNVTLNKMLAPELEARYKLTNLILDKLIIKQIVEIASGYTSRGVYYSKKGINYIECDLEDVIKIKKDIIKSLNELNDNLHFINFDATKKEDFNKLNNILKKTEPIVFVSEGLFRYMTFDEKTLVAQNIYSMLKKFGGYWITCDITPKKFVDVQNKKITGINNDLNNITKRNDLQDRFENEEHIRNFFSKIGFKKIEFHKFIEVKECISSFDILNIDKNSMDELLENALVAVISID